MNEFHWTELRSVNASTAIDVGMLGDEGYRTSSESLLKTESPRSGKKGSRKIVRFDKSFIIYKLIKSFIEPLASLSDEVILDLVSEAIQEFRQKK